MIGGQPNPRGWCFLPGKPVRGYDSSSLFREDCLERITHLQVEVNADMRELARQKKEHASSEERLRKLKKEFDGID